MNDAALAATLPEDEAGYWIQEPEGGAISRLQARALQLKERDEGATDAPKPKFQPVPTRQAARWQILTAMDEMLKKSGMPRAERRTFLYKKPRSFDLGAMSRELVHQIEDNNRFKTEENNHVD